VKIIAANGGKKNKPIVFGRYSQMKKVAALPGHQYRAKGNIQAAEKKKIKNFADPSQGFRYY
jgi:hypothetical protein